MKLEEFLAVVKQEAVLVKVSATQAQKDLINLDTFNPVYDEHCLFGQMTGSADSDRAKALLPKNVNLKFEVSQEESIKLPKLRFGFDRLKFNSEGRLLMTHLEAFLMCDGNGRELLRFVKGEIDSFEPIVTNNTVEITL